MQQFWQTRNNLLLLKLGEDTFQILWHLHDAQSWESSGASEMSTNEIQVNKYFILQT